MNVQEQIDEAAKAAIASQAPVAEKPPQRGRSAMLSSYREKYPDAGEDIADDDLYDYADGRYKDVQGRYDELAGANKRLAELTASDPRLAAVLTMIAGKDAKSLPYAISRVYGKDFLELEGEELDEFEKGYKEKLEELAAEKSAIAEASKNVDEYQKTLAAFAKKNGLSDDETEQLYEAIYKDAMDILSGVISESFIDYKWKGLNYNKDVQDAAAAGLAEGKTQKAEAKMRTAAKQVPAGAAVHTSAGRQVPKAEKRSFYDGLETN